MNGTIFLGKLSVLRRFYHKTPVPSSARTSEDVRNSQPQSATKPIEAHILRLTTFAKHLSHPSHS